MNFEKPSEENMELFSKGGAPEVVESETEKQDRLMDNAKKEYGQEWDMLNEEQKLVVALVPKEKMTDEDEGPDDFYYVSSPQNYPPEKQAMYKEARAIMDKAKEERQKGERATEEKIKKSQLQAERDKKAGEDAEKRDARVKEKAAAAGVTPEEYVSQRKQENKETQA